MGESLAEVEGMSAECYPVSVLPHITRLFTDYLAMGEDSGQSVRKWYGADPAGRTWTQGFTSGSAMQNSGRLADALHKQSLMFEAGAAALANIDRLRHGARAVVTGQQVGLFGGPLLTLLKAATAVARAAQATAATGVEHVPIFWLASEDHDLEEVDQVVLLAKHDFQKLTLSLKSTGGEVGGIMLGDSVTGLLEQVAEMLAFAPVVETLKQCYTPQATLAGAFARLMAKLFSAHGLVVMDASGREFHALGIEVMRAGIERASELEAALMARSRELEAAGYHAQVLVKEGASLLFLLDEQTGGRQLLRHTSDGAWKAGNSSFTKGQLLGILESTPERISPNALLRPVFQDAILPTAAYIGGPAEIAYFAQSAILYEKIIGRVTPILPRFSATLIEPAVGAVMARDEVSLKDVFEAKSVEALAQRLGARAMPIAGKRHLAAVGNAMENELGALTSYLESMDESLGRSAQVSASKMRYQMNRLRRMAATFETQKEASLGRHAKTLITHLFPGGHPQERVVGGVWFLAQGGEELIGKLVEEASRMCLGHSVVRI